MEYTIQTDPRLPCNHTYCIDCLQELFMKSMQDETLMPPRCCQKIIPIDLARLTSKEIENFNAKHLEYSTKDRLYCSQPTCSTFIPPALIVDSIGTCPKPGCQVKTCSICKAASHGNFDCPKDEATSAVLATAREAGWTRCYQCRAMIELTHGCYHMTCRCRAQFCYICSTPWKNCQCPQWDEQNLYDEARARAERIPALQMPHANNRIQMNEYVQRMANQLRANHECEHTNGWAYTPGGANFRGEDKNKKPILPYAALTQMMRFYFDNDCEIIVRSSETEPKIKWYSKKKQQLNEQQNFFLMTFQLIAFLLKILFLF
ncbi:unnamed protein product [Rotaria sp. Silwood1]|nr:unnamed protein product [Rotaria sp. Silwood1]CAF1633896.1 unnamed protein product [Rotaria sp. Silwood1]